MKSAAFNLFKAIGTEIGKPMILNCTALELAYIAANRIDGVLNFGEKSYDYAAGLFLVKAAGGHISVFEHNTRSPWTGSLKELCAEHGKTMFISHGGIHTKALELIGNPRDWSDEQ